MLRLDLLTSLVTSAFLCTEQRTFVRGIEKYKRSVIFPSVAGLTQPHLGLTRRWRSPCR
jgi:hypothetical protein